jgi:hypothetical protein
MPNIRSVKYTIGKEDAGTPGTAVSRTDVLPVADIGDLDRKPTKETDPVLSAAGMKTGDYVAFADTSGSLPISPRACAGWAHVVNGSLGTEAASPPQLAGVIRLRYTGSSASCKITTANGAKTINAKIGALGAESNDAAFGTSGTIDLTGSGFDTLTELVAAIDAYANYECKLVTGTGSNTITSVVEDVYQAKNGWVFIFLTGTTSGAYLHTFTPNLTVDSERPTYSIQKDGFGDNFLYDGCVFDELSISGSLKAAIEASTKVLGMGETIGQVASALTLEDRNVFIFGYGLTSIAGIDYDYCRKHSIGWKAGHLDDGYGQSDLDRAYQQKGLFEVTGDMTLKLNAAAYAERAKVAAGTEVKIALFYFGAEQQKIGGGVAEMMLIVVPYAKLQSWDAEKNGEVIDAKTSWEGFNPPGTPYEEPLYVYLITDDSAVY